MTLILCRFSRYILLGSLQTRYTKEYWDCESYLLVCKHEDCYNRKAHVKFPDTSNVTLVYQRSTISWGWVCIIPFPFRNTYKVRWWRTLTKSKDSVEPQVHGSLNQSLSKLRQKLWHSWGNRVSQSRRRMIRLAVSAFIAAHEWNRPACVDDPQTIIPCAHLNEHWHHEF